MVILPRPKKQIRKKNSLLLLNYFIKVTTNLIKYKQLLQGWISINNIFKQQELYSAFNQVVYQIILANSADPSDISDFAIRHLLQEYIMAPAKNFSAIYLSSTTPPKSLKYHHALSVNDKAIWDMAYEDEYYGIYNKKNLNLHLGRRIPSYQASCW